MTPKFRRWKGTGTHPRTGTPIEVLKTEYLGEDDLLELNHQRRMASHGKRWTQGAGSDKGGNMPMVHVASVPINVWLDRFADKLREGDDDHMRWSLNHESMKPFRTREGTV